jgi:hypothetical protein
VKAPTPKIVEGSSTCEQCSSTFRYKKAESAPTPPICGALECRALQEWGEEEWAGRLRMAKARRAAGRPLDRLDRIAIREAEASAS